MSILHSMPLRIYVIELISRGSYQGLLTDLSRLFQRRRRIALSKVEQYFIVETKTWGNLLARRFAFPTKCRNLHTLFCPHGMTETTFNPMASTRDTKTSLAALKRIGNSFRTMSHRSSFQSEGLLSNLEQIQYEDELDYSNRQHSQHEQNGESRHRDPTNSYYGDQQCDASSYAQNDDDLEVMSRAFTVDSVEIDEQMDVLGFDQQAQPTMQYDDSNYYDQESIESELEHENNNTAHQQHYDEEPAPLLCTNSNDEAVSIT